MTEERRGQREEGEYLTSLVFESTSSILTLVVSVPANTLFSPALETNTSFT